MGTRVSPTKLTALRRLSSLSQQLFPRSSHFVTSKRPFTASAMASHLTDDCIFCKIIRGQIPSFKLVDTEKTYAFLDIGPLSKGHCLVIPKYHGECCRLRGLQHPAEQRRYRSPGGKARPLSHDSQAVRERQRGTRDRLAYQARRHGRAQGLRRRARQE